MQSDGVVGGGAVGGEAFAQAQSRPSGAMEDVGQGVRGLPTVWNRPPREHLRPPHSQHLALEAVDAVEQGQERALDHPAELVIGVVGVARGPGGHQRPQPPDLEGQHHPGEAGLLGLGDGRGEVWRRVPVQGGAGRRRWQALRCPSTGSASTEGRAARGGRGMGCHSPL